MIILYNYIHVHLINDGLHFHKVILHPCDKTPERLLSRQINNLVTLNTLNLFASSFGNILYA